MHGDQAASRCDVSRLTCPVRARRRTETARRHRSASDDVRTPAMRCGVPGYSTCRRRRRCDANARAGSDRRRASRRMQRSARARTHPVQRRDRQDRTEPRRRGTGARARAHARFRTARRIGCALRSDGDVRSCPANRLPPSFATRGRSSKRSGGRSGKPMVAARDCVTRDATRPMALANPMPAFVPHAPVQRHGGPWKGNLIPRRRQPPVPAYAAFSAATSNFVICIIAAATRAALTSSRSAIIGMSASGTICHDTP